MRSTRLQEAMTAWDAEVEAEAVVLIERGTPPMDAIEQARGIVTRRRRAAYERTLPATPATPTRPEEGAERC